MKRVRRLPTDNNLLSDPAPATSYCNCDITGKYNMHKAHRATPSEPKHQCCETLKSVKYPSTLAGGGGTYPSGKLQANPKVAHYWH